MATQALRDACFIKKYWYNWRRFFLVLLLIIKYLIKMISNWLRLECSHGDFRDFLPKNEKNILFNDFLNLMYVLIVYYCMSSSNSWASLFWRLKIGCLK